MKQPLPPAATTPPLDAQSARSSAPSTGAPPATLPEFSEELSQLIAISREALEDAYHPLAVVYARFHESAARALPELDEVTRQRAWGAVLRPQIKSDLRAVQLVPRAGRAGQISLYLADVFRLPAEQWLCSAFGQVVAPSGGAWCGFWRAAGRDSVAWTELTAPPIEPLGPDQQVFLLKVNPRARQGLPTVVLSGLGSQRYHQDSEGGRWPEWVYFDALRACRALGREGRLGRRVAMPVLFSSLHGIDYETAISLQRRFSLDLLRQEETVQEVMISVLDEPAMGALLEAWHLATGDHHVTSQDNIAGWIKTALNALEGELRSRLSGCSDQALEEGIRSVLQRVRAEPLYLNDVALLARNIVEDWAHGLCVSGGIKADMSLASMVSHLRGRSGTPNRSLLYVDAIRELGNVGAHFRRAPHPLLPEDLISIFLGLSALLQLNEELRKAPLSPGGS